MMQQLRAANERQQRSVARVGASASGLFGGFASATFVAAALGTVLTTAIAWTLKPCVRTTAIDMHGNNYARRPQERFT